MSRWNLPGSGRRRFAPRSSAMALVLVMVGASVLLGEGAAVGATAAAGGTGAATAAGAQAAPASDPSVPVMIVLDASGSMNTEDAPGPRIEAAKAAVANLVGSLPAQTQVGLQVYGTGTGSTDAEKAAGCTDIKTLVPVGALDAAALKAQVGRVVAAGYTPIGNALRAAADALPNEGPRSIVLVSDGEDTCAPPAPCDVARELKQQGIDLVVHTVGFKVDPIAREQLSCIAEATGGTYSDADDATQLNTALETKVDYAVTGYTLQGSPVSGAAKPSEGAPLLAPGQYTDTLENSDFSVTDNSGTIKYYTVPVRPGVRLYVSVTIVPPDSPATDISGFGTDADLLNEDLISCSGDYGRNVEVVNPDRRQAVTTVITEDIGGVKYGKKCPQQGVLILQIQRLGTAYQGREVPIEIAIRSEPAADSSSVPPPAEKAAEELPVPVHGAATPISGGDSFNNAPEITSGTTYSDTVVTGDLRYFRIPLQWGQRFSYLLTPDGSPQPKLSPGAYASVDVFNPVRQSIEMTDHDIGGEFWFNSGPPNSFSAATIYPARYTNRLVYDSAQYSLNGDYYLRLMIPFTDKPSSEGYLLTVNVVGEVEAGPVYRTGDAAATASASTAGTVSSEAQSASAGSSEGATDSAASSSGGSGGSGPTTDSAASASSSSASGASIWLYVAIGLLILLAAATVLLVLSRRHPVPPSHS